MDKIDQIPYSNSFMEKIELQLKVNQNKLSKNKKIIISYKSQIKNYHLI